ncbi:MAG: DMT family transporter [Muribaculaceae bacterium]|nr:DMT family transporter [Muribaculaceae bacterium]
METSRPVGNGRVWIYHIFALIVIVAWGLSFISTRVLLDNGLHPIEIYIYRFVIAYLALLAVCHDKLWANSLKDEGMFVVCGLVAGSIYFISENVALEYTLVSNVSLITSLPPLLTVLLMGLVYKTDKPGSGAYIGSIVAFLGVGLVIFNSSFNMSINPIGDLLALLAAFCWAIYSLILKPLNVHYDARFITRKVFFYGVLTALPFLLVEPQIAPIATLGKPVVLWNLLFLSLVCSLACYLLWAYAVLKIGAVTASNYLYFQPVVTMIFSFVILHETITAVGMTGCLMILLGVWLADYLQRRKIFAK